MIDKINANHQKTEQSNSDQYIDVFPQFEELKGFFATKYGASNGYPYNREDVFEENGLAEAIPVWPKQIHKNHIEIIEQRPYRPLELPDTDGLITNLRGVLLTTIHADCLPVYFFDPLKNVIGLVHAGWRGTAAGIAPKAAALMQKEFRSDPADIQVFIGPGISKCCFEVGAEVYEEFKGKWGFIDDFAEKKAMDEAGSLANAKASKAFANVEPCRDASEENTVKYHIDLKSINSRQMQEAGIPKGNIEISPHCTCCQPELFCSYRREGGTELRMGAGLCLI